MEDLKFNFDLQTFADGVADGVADVGMEQPEVDSTDTDVPDFGIDEDGNLSSLTRAFSVMAVKKRKRTQRVKLTHKDNLLNQKHSLLK